MVWKIISLFILMALPMGVVHAVPEDEVQGWKDSYMCSKSEEERIAMGLAVLTNAALQFGDTEGKNPAHVLGAPPLFGQVYLNELVCQHSTGTSQNFGFSGGKLKGGNANVVKELDNILEGDDNHEKRDAIIEQTKVLVQIMDIQKEIDDASATLTESINNNQGSLGLPIPGSINMGEVPEDGPHTRGNGEIMEEALKNGSTGVGIATKMDEGMVVTKDDGVSITDYIAMTEYQVMANGGSMYPDVQYPFTLIFTPTGSKEEIIEQIDIINDMSFDMFSSMKEGTDGKSEGAVSVVIRKSAHMDSWDDVIVHVNNMDNRAVTLATTVDKMHGLEDDQNLYSIAEIPVPRAFWTKDAANNWLRENNIPEIEDGFDDYAAVKIKVSNKNDGYGLSIAENVGNVAQQKGLTTMATSLVDHKGNVSDLKDYFNDFLSTANYQTISRWAGINLSSFVANKATKFGLDNVNLATSRMGDVMYKGGIMLSNEDKRLLRRASGEALEEGMEKFSDLPPKQQRRAAQKYAIGYKNELLKNLSGANGIPTDFKGGATGHIRDSISRAGAVSNDITNSVKGWSISKTPIPRVQQSQMAKLAGHKAAQTSMTTIMSNAAATKGAAMALRTASSKMVALAGGPVGWSVAAFITVIDIYYNWDDYVELTKGVYRLSMRAMGKNPYPDPTESDEKALTWIASSYSSVGFLDISPEKYAHTVANDQDWMSSKMAPLLMEERNQNQPGADEFPDDGEHDEPK